MPPISRPPFVLLGLLAACGGPSVQETCDNYVQSWRSCAEEAFSAEADLLDDALNEAEGACDAYADVEADEAEKLIETLDCYAVALDDGDCGDPTGYAAALVDVSLCNSPIGF